MTPVHLQQWIQHPEALNRDTLYELRTLVARYPYFQSLRLLYLKNLYVLHDINFGAELRKAVLYVSDRRVLFYLIEGDRYALHPHTSAHAVGKELEKGAEYRPYSFVNRRFPCHCSGRTFTDNGIGLCNGLYRLPDTG